MSVVNGLLRDGLADVHAAQLVREHLFLASLVAVKLERSSRAFSNIWSTLPDSEKLSGGRFRSVPNVNMMIIILEGEGERPIAGRAHMSVACCARFVVLLDQRFARGREHCTPLGVAPQRAREL